MSKCRYGLSEDCNNIDTRIKEFIKKNYEPVEDKPGYVWFSKRNLQIIKIETLAESLKEGWIRGLFHLTLEESEDQNEMPEV